MNYQRGQIGDIWRFDAPEWEPERAVRHYLITGIMHTDSRYSVLYSVIELETGIAYPDLVLDDANVRNYNARKVA